MIVFAICWKTLLLGALSLAGGFRNPPASARPQVWWHWINGNVSREGITADLESMAEIGIGGACIFDAGCGLPPGPVAFDSKDWYDALKFAAREARRLGLELTVANCSGWSTAGGPWVSPSNSMKTVVWTERRIEVERSTVCRLPRPNSPFGFYEDIAVVACPVPLASRDPLPEPSVLPQIPDTGFQLSSGTNEFLLSYPHPVSVRHVRIRAKSGYAWLARLRVMLEASDDGRDYRKIGERDLTVTSGFVHDESEQCFTLPDRTGGRFFRMRISPLNQTAYSLYDVGLGSEARISDAGFKTLRIWGRGQADAGTLAASEVPALKDLRILKVSKGEDDTLACRVPPGNWRVFRFGYRANGRRNHPASARGGGLEVDKFSADAVSGHFDAYVGKVCHHLGELAGHGNTGVTGVLIDSYEAGSQNWTRGLEREFRRRKGYDLLPFLPVFAGVPVDGFAASERVMSDFRDVLSELFAEGFGGTMARKCHERGLRLHVEPYGNGPFRELQYARCADVLMGEFWACPGNGASTLDSLKMPASAAHLLGRRIVAAEAYTAAETAGRWQKDPFGLKAQGDRAYAKGVNRIVYHRFVHQPWTDPHLAPGLTLGKYGIHFERTVTWWRFAKPWIDYQSRCQYMLQAGSPCADVLVWRGDDMPDAEDPVRLPEGYDWDICDSDMLEGATRREGRIVMPGGGEYRKIVGLQEIKSGWKPDFPPDFLCLSGARKDLMTWTHRRGPEGEDCYFVAIPNPQSGEYVLSFRQTGRIPELWDPEQGVIQVPRVWNEKDGRTVVHVSLRPSGSLFVVFRSRGAEDLPVEGVLAERTVQRISGPWRLSFPPGWDASERVVLTNLISWTELPNDADRHFSGTAAYDTHFTVVSKAEGVRYVVDLGEVKNLARVTINGVRYDPLWRPPFAQDVTESLRVGRNDMKVEVVNLWPNRLIGDESKEPDRRWNGNGRSVGILEVPKWVGRGERSPTGRLSFSAWRHWMKDDALLPSGLLGPVTLKERRER